jgi:rubredoxin
MSGNYVIICKEHFKICLIKAMNEAANEKTLAEQAPSSYECRSCGYVYVPAKGDNKTDIPAGTLFTELPTSWRCPVCGAGKRAFTDIGATDAPSGFADNLNYGFGVNRMTPGQKNLLIFGALALGFLFFISLYGLN